MCRHEVRSCPRCHKAFECKPANITQCQCFGISMGAAAKAFIEQRYTDCLCRDCLVYLQDERRLFKEKFLSRES